MTTLRLATRKSALALAQSRMVARALESLHPGLSVEEVQLTTQGDRVQDRSLAAIGGKGLFVKEIEEALLEGRADLAVHSMKDLPATVPEGLTVCAVPNREDPFDLLVTRDGRGLDALAPGATVGTSSRRRELLLLEARPDLTCALLRGNVDTRLRRLEEGAYDAIVLAAAGVRRLGLSVRGVSLEGALLPAIAQGALALEAREDDARTRMLVAPLDDPRTRLETHAERAVLRALGGSCVTPVAAYARLAGDGAMRIDGFLATEDGSRRGRAYRSGKVVAVASAEALGRSLAEGLAAALG
ncbi:MAG: hydroxymethylbilane synthase [Deltaproteobacteria bacterium]|nr:hydroxymethylbilane synthase [Deltaproteobacteria bacterium]